jgi:NAD(P)-dependent dehydrogenase (short-subunit alcohol dehydrogenase family)
MLSFDFSGKNVVITGASRGIGRAIAIKMAAAGCQGIGSFSK